MGFLAEIGIKSLNKHGEELCGDNVLTGKTSDSYIIVLSDGLGSGVKANILSTLTTKIAATMLEGGSPIEDVVDTVGRTLPVCKVRKVAYSTFTIIQVFTDGQVYLAEFGNPATFYLHRGQVLPVPVCKREVAGREIRESRFTARNDDVLIAVSDGVVHAGIGATLNLGWQWDNIARFLERTYDPAEDARALTGRLANIVQDLYSGSPGDDATVVSVRVRQPRLLTVAVGPPVNRQDDTRMAQMLEQARGKRVICGCTTSKLIARELGRELRVDLEHMEPNVPPAGVINGIDLVTEGMITLTQALERLRDPEAGSDGKTNPVERLVSLFDISDKIHFLVGRAKNPAYQNPTLPYDLSLKQQVITELGDLLLERGKEVQYTYF